MTDLRRSTGPLLGRYLAALALVVAPACGESDSDDRPVAGGAGAMADGGLEAGGAGSAGAAGGSTSCSALEAQYAQALAQARACDLAKPGCTASVDDRLACPCPTFADASHAAQLEQLKTLRAAWTENACGEGVQCPLTPCPAPASASCEALPAGARCVDQP